MVHGDADDGYPVFVDALVNMRHTLARAVATGVVCSELAERIIETARATPFTMRTWARLLSEVGAPDQRGLAAQLRSLRVDVKHADALLALRQLGQRPRVEPLRPGPPPTVWSRRWRAAMGTAHLRRRIGRPRRVFCRRHRLGGLVVFERELG